MSIAIDIPSNQIADLCQRFQVRELALFGSALRKDFAPRSDLDFLVDFDGGYTLDMLMDMRDELQRLFARDVDLIVKKVVQSDQNYLRRKVILDSAQVIYAHRG